MPGPQVLIVEDEPDIGELIRHHVDREGFSSRLVGTGYVALEEIRRRRPDLVILDLMLPDLDGLELCRRMKWDESTRAVPIVIVSAKGEESDIVAGLELGADDYVTKPFSPRVLMARIRNVMRRTRTAPASPAKSNTRMILAEGRLVIDPDRRTVEIDGGPIDLTKTEFDILHYLAVRPGFVRTRDQMLAIVHGHEVVRSKRTVDVHVNAIRRKLGPLEMLIGTVRGVGYRLDDERSDDNG